MFTIITQNQHDLASAEFILQHYCVVSTYYSLSYEDERAESMITVCDETRDGDLMMAEMAFQINFKQTGFVCPLCKKEGLKVCGHLTFQGMLRETPDLSMFSFLPA